MPNQNKPTPPLEDIAPHILRYWKARQTDKKIVENLQDHFDTSRYGLGYTKFREIRNDMGLLRTRQQSHTIESIHEAMIELRKAYPNAGAREMVILLFHEKEMSVSRNLVIAYCAVYEADLVHQRKARRLKRRRFWAAGVNDLFAVDQHDKWLRFGLALHTGVEPFSGRIMWIRVWHSNRNPQLILTYYLDTIQKLGHIPLVTQSDPGTENYGIANAHTMLRQMYDPALQGTLQHLWMRTKKNVKPEITWSQLRRRFTPGFETLLDEGVENGWYDSDNTLQVMIFRWIFIPWLQCELDRYQDRVNNTLKRPDRNKVLPHGVPNLIYESPEDFGALDFKVTVKQDDIDYVRRLYVNPDHPVFDLVPRPLNNFIQGCYEDLGRPPITRQSVWTIYLDLYDSMQRSVQVPAIVRSLTAGTDPDEEPLPLLENQNDLFFHEDTDGAYYMGGIHGGQGLDASDHHRLDELAELDEPGAHLLPTAPIIEEEALVIAGFSDEEDNDETFDW
ncbi:hypothetical protein DEU56DRAFT_754729 [Suillus clintonianus]|uniref:uncharacterized protein n=2 Tax=Suillus clintonianus TaxID=1904413 RepID=UPI001B8708D1|nr:uncharacterized protein DEU56DRAFT_754729 [Suillus clintonianus]KAG2142390.1 hypothetical protein DEU56DRAFT_754729 [Suillus clintonianus]